MSMMDFLKIAMMDVDHDGFSHRAVTIERLRDVGVPEPAVLAAVKTWLKAQVDAEAERRRGRVATPGSGQAMEYQEAQAQAAAALKAPGSATPEKYPMLAASVGIDLDPTTGAPAADVVGVARSVQAARDAWAGFGAAIRQARLATKAAIAAAADVAAAAAAYDAADWPAEGG